MSRHVLLVLLVAGLVLLVLWLRSDASPVQVLGCTWQRATVDAPATNDPNCDGDLP